MATPERQELIRNAVVFLNDPKARIHLYFATTKLISLSGLTPAEVDVAFRQAAASGPAPPAAPYAGAYGPNPYLPQPPRSDWRDYFITGVVSGAITYGAITLFRKYLLPHLQPPEATAYEQDRDALNAQFDAAEALLKEIQTETAAVRVAVEEQKAKVDQTTEDVKAVVTEMREGEVKTRDEIREIREEVNNIREMLPRMIEKNKESQTQSLGELQQELKSLKALLLSRGPTASLPSSPLPMIGRTAIPAWQLAGAPQTPPVASPQTNGPSSEASDKGKGVERENSKTES
ncbi:hypothetical protein EST38_g5962 [Candolleomyces aberdarensis]|uniref:Peroxisomal membrane protein PEX14 n=1 Tax=Candolleomyces aberdarensis TaxID=2316362 RepID=A0A4Q2DIN8_9AGAR|nr:hypothetical protein EST38_g5962 [Candolleomyces aberdarensis]